MLQVFCKIDLLFQLNKEKELLFGLFLSKTSTGKLYKLLFSSLYVVCACVCVCVVCVSMQERTHTYKTEQRKPTSGISFYRLKELSWAENKEFFIVHE